MNNQKVLDWFQNQIEKDKIEIDEEKKKFVNSIKKVEKKEIFENKIKKISLWKRILKVLGGI